MSEERETDDEVPNLWPRGRLYRPEDHPDHIQDGEDVDEALRRRRAE